MPALEYFNRPEYLLRPRQIYRRLLHPPQQSIEELVKIVLPWKASLKIHPYPREVVERSLFIFGIYDLCLSETLWRLIDPGEITIDVGANIGYVASLMAARVGEKGKVICFEPNPEVYRELEENVKNWQETQGWQHLQLSPLALSDRAGSSTLKIPKYNRSAAALADAIAPADEETLQSYTVDLMRLDDFFAGTKPEIGVLKIDVEGHEFNVFQGAEQILSQHRIRDIIFEEHQSYPSAAMQFLEQKGYSIFRLWKGFWKPVLYPSSYDKNHPWEPPNYLATLEPDRAVTRLKQRGWKIFKHEL
ncbi:FkbM family methyltransferase [Oscillatoria sp. FACHB-1406]|uniref:FkbM family methyltransferase n=1 Tax=Oscillatoria sp. FACHB-1406 TaxID=2692846 RepID=UPI001687738E|nr:FkbM family methyltransferase [Oscillatoria sp. FACHB-1406]MBD2578749.1 FkbM family methyltransferase [Oscillatoria sp. FACHB-1406]